MVEVALELDHVDPTTQHHADSETASHFVEAQTGDDLDDEAESSQL